MTNNGLGATSLTCEKLIGHIPIISYNVMAALGFKESIFAKTLKIIQIPKLQLAQPTTMHSVNLFISAVTSHQQLLNRSSYASLLIQQFNSVYNHSISTLNRNSIFNNFTLFSNHFPFGQNMILHLKDLPRMFCAMFS